MNPLPETRQEAVAGIDAQNSQANEAGEIREKVIDVFLILIVAAIYFISARFGLSVAYVNKSATAIWPPTGISLALVLLLGPRITPGIYLGAFLANLFTAGNIATSLVIAAGNTLEATAGAALVTRFAGGVKAFDRTQDVIRFILFAPVLSTMISATVGVGILTLGGFAQWSDDGPVWLTWWLGDAISALVIAPLIIIWATKPPHHLNVFQWIEALCLAALFFVCMQIVFAGKFLDHAVSFPYSYMVFPLVLWAAFRFYQHGTVIALIFVACTAAYYTLSGKGPFSGPNPNNSLLHLEVFIGAVAVTKLVVAATVHERKEINDALRESTARAEQANKAKDEFLAMLSHELRTPLTPVLLTVSLLESHPNLPADVHDDIQTIRRNVELENRLINDLLDLSRVETGKLVLALAHEDAHRLILAAADICGRNEQPKISLQLWASRHFVYGDGARLQQVFWNLISNARKFTPLDGNIVIQTADAENDFIRISVSDTGVGIAPDQIAKLFGAFEQGENAIRHRIGGLGLGLAICKHLVEAHGGTISAHSEGRGTGTTIVVELPTVVEPTIATVKSDDGRPSKSDVSLRILLVEDNEPTREVLTKLLERLGHRVTGVFTVADALAAIKAQSFDLLISDVGLPDGSGLDLMRQVRERYASRSIALTGYGMTEDLHKSQEAGFTHHLTKPVDFSELQETIEMIAAANSEN
ncbi:MAG TPA: MASE1 domain-containing protein [Phycisphaerae bacterium]|nr:MASE1 domain-containing protein [Phycisphaerae bacterium]